MAQFEQSLGVIGLGAQRLAPTQRFAAFHITSQEARRKRCVAERELHEPEDGERVRCVPVVTLGVSLCQQLARYRPSLVGQTAVGLDNGQVVPSLTQLRRLRHLRGYFEVFTCQGFGSGPVPGPQLELWQMAERIGK